MKKMSKFEGYSRFVTWFMASLLVALAAGCGGGGGGGRDPILGGVLPTLVSLAVTPATASIPITGTQQFTATAVFSDGSSRDVTATSSWVSGTPANATVAPATGLATGVLGGTSVITANFGTLSGSATLTVTSATSALFIVTPATASIPVSGTQQFAAIQIFSDGTSQDRTTTSVWSTSGASAANASVGAATGRAVGITVTPAGVPVVINATFTPLGGPALVATPAALTVNAATSVSFVVTPATASIPVGGTQQFAAIQTFSDGTTQNRTLTSAAGTTSWSTSGASAANASVGVATGLALGVTVTPAGVPVVINATFTPVGGAALVATPAALTVNAATSVSFVVTPTPASTTVGGTQQFAAIQTFSDGTTQDRTLTSAAGTTSWSTSGASAANATVGAATGLALGVLVTPAGVPVVINATFTPLGGAALVATPATLTVTPAAAGNPGPAGAVDLLTATPFGLIAFDAMTINTAASHIFGDVALISPVGVIASVIGPGTNNSGVAPQLRSSAVTDTFSVPPTPGLITATNNGTPASIAALPQLRADLNNVFLNDLLIRAAPGTLLTTPASAAAAGVSGGTFGAATDLSGFVLRPGIYTTAGTYGLSNALGPLVLNAEGNADAVFIIRALGATGLTSTTGSVVLQGGAQAKNIFWVMSANATIGDNLANTFFQGTLLAGNVITLGSTTNVQGRMLAGARLAISGAITLSGTNVVTVPQ